MPTRSERTRACAEPTSHRLPDHHCRGQPSYRNSRTAYGLFRPSRQVLEHWQRGQKGEESTDIERSYPFLARQLLRWASHGIEQ